MSWRDVFQTSNIGIIGNIGIISSDAQPRTEIIPIIPIFPKLDDLKMNLEEVKKAAGKDWLVIKNNPEILKAFASALETTEQMEAGIIPKHYTKTVDCENCGSVKLWGSCPDIVQGCPWCLISENKLNPVKNREITVR